VSYRALHPVVDALRLCRIVHNIPIPPGAVTGIGSLPMDDPHVAVQFVEQECPLMPFWPELPRRSPEARSVEQTFGPKAVSVSG
jgi:hypothetical protein